MAKITETSRDISYSQMINVLASTKGQGFAEDFVKGEYDQLIEDMTLHKLKLGIKVGNAVSNDVVLSTQVDARLKYEASK